MFINTKKLVIATIMTVLALATHSALAATQTLDWDLPASAWPDSSLSNSYPLGSGNVNISVSGNLAALDGIAAAGTPPIAPGIRNIQEGGFGGAEQSLHFAKDYPPGVTQADYEIAIAIDFTHPAGVNNVAFTIFDVDRSNNANNFWDRVVVTATAVGGGTVDPSSIVLPGLGFNQLNPASPTNTVEGTASSAPNTGNANASFTFNQNISQIVIQWQYPIEGPDNDPNRKVIALHDITFNDPEADISITKVVDNNNPQVGQNVVFTLTAANGGPDAATGVEVTDALPAGYTFVSAVGDGTYTSGTGVWDIGNIANGTNASIDITATVNASGPYANTATITAADQPDPDLTNNSDSITPIIDLVPVASPDTNTATEGGAAVAGDVLANDTIGDGPTTVTAADQGGTPIALGIPFATANGGLLTLNSDGTYSYTPPALGSVPPAGLTEVFNYTITDADGDPSSSTLTITVNDSDLLPVASPDTNTAVEGAAAVAGDLLANDTLGDAPTTVTAADEGGTPITLGTPFATANGGSLTINSDGTYSYTPPALGSVPPAGLTEVFNYTITDSDGDPSSSTLTITVNDSDQLPVASPDTNTAVEGAAAVAGDVLANDTLGDAPTTVTAADEGGTPITLGTPFATANGGSLTINSDGTYSYTPPALGNVPPAGLTEVFNYTITDADGDPSSSTLTITVNDSDLLPVASPDTNTAVEGAAAVAGDLLANDTLGDAPTTVTAADEGGTPITLGTPFATANGGSLTINSDGTYSYTPPALGNVPPAGLTEVFNYTITDADGDPSSSTLTITVNDSDLLPVASPDTNTAVEGAAAVAGDLLANDTLGDAPTTVTAADEGGTPITLGTPFATANGGSLTINADGTYSYTPPALGNVPPAGLTEVFNYTITDSDGDPSSSTLTITVNDSDQLPVASPDTNTAVEGAAAVAGDLLANDTLGDAPTTVTAADEGGTPITLGTPFATANGGSLTINSDGTYSYTPPALGSVPPAGLTEVFNYTITDSDGDPSSSTLTITVNDSDQLPVASPDTNTAVEGAAAVAGDVLANDTLGDAPTTVTAADEGGTPITLGTPFATANGGSLTINSDGTYSYTPPALGNVPPAGLTEVFNYTITDADGDPSSSTLTITVNDSDLLPVASPDTNTAVEGAAAVAGDLLANDTLGDAPTTVTAADEGGTPITLGTPFATANGGSLTINSDGTYSYTPPALGNVPPAGLTEVFNYTITDADGDPSSSTLTITVNDSDLLPVASPDTNTATEGAAAVAGDVLANDTLGDAPTTVTAADEGGTPITLGTPFATANGGSLTINSDGTYSYTPPALGSVPPAGLTEVFNYTITDADGDPSSSTLTITVNDSDLLPVASPDTNTAVEGAAAVAGDVLANDTLGDAPTTVTAADEGGTPITLGTPFATANGGSLTINSDGTYSYTPPALGNVPPAGLTEVFNYTITDADGDPSSSTLTITVNDSDLLPVASPDTNTAVEDAAAVAGDVLANDTLGDAPTTVTAADEGGTPITLGTPFATANGGSLTINSDGTYSYTPPALGSVPPAGLTEVFNYTITDADGDPSSSTLTIGVSDAAALADLSLNKTIDNPTPDVGSTVVFTLNLNNAGPDTVNAQVTDNLPSGYTYVSDNGAGSYNSGTGVWTVNGLIANNAIALNITATVNASGDYTNVAEVSLSNASDPNSTPGNGVPTEDDYASVTPAVNQLPAASPDTNTAVEGAAAVAGDVLANDTLGDAPTTVTAADEGGTPITLGTPFATANGGSLTINSDGTYSYTPPALGNVPPAGLTEVFNYTITDADGDPSSSTLTITVNDSDLLPVASPDTNTAVEGAAAVAGDVLANDTLGDAPTTVTAADEGGTPITLGTPFATANGGSLTINSDGTYSYTPPALGNVPPAGLTEVFNYTITDSDGDPSSSTLTITVNDSDQLPVASPDTNTAVEGAAAVAGDVLANDTLGDAPTTVTAADEGGTPITLGTPFATANGGSLTINSDGTYSYTPPALGSVPPAGLTEVFNYTITDADGDPSSSTLTITVNDSDQLPVASPDTNTAVEGAAAVAGDVLANDTLGDAPTTVTAADEGGTPITLGTPFATANGGSLTINTDGTYSYTPPALGNVPPAGLTEVFNYTITDSDGDPSSATLTIGVNDVAALADLSLNKTIDNPTPDVGSTVVFTLNLNNAGPDTVNAQVTDNLPSGYTYVSDDGAGSYNSGTGVWNVTGLIANNAIALNITATVNASGDYTNVAEVSLSNASDPNSTPGNGVPTEDDYSSLTPAVNNLPTAAADTNTAAEGAAAVAGDVLANDTLGDAPTTVTAADEGGTPITLGTPFATANGGSLTINSDGTYSYTPPAFGNVPPAGLTEVFNYTITDADGDPSSSTLTIAVNNADQLPVASPDTNTAVEGAAAVAGDVLANDTLGDAPTTVTAADEGGTPITLGTPFATANGGSLTINTDGTYSYTPPALGSVPPGGLTEVFNYTITDNDGDPSSSTLTLAVNDGAAVADLSLNKTIDNPTPNVGDTVVFTLTLNNAGPDTADALVADSLPSGYAYVSDNGAGSYNSGTGVWAVTGLTTGAAATLNITVTVNATGNYTNIAEVDSSNASDPNSTPGNGVPTEDDYASSTPTVNNPPVAVDDSDGTAVDTAKEINVLLNDSDPDGDTLTITAVQGVTDQGGSAVINDNGTPADPTDDTITYTPATGFMGSDTFTYEISDGNGNSDTATVTVAVPPNMADLSMAKGVDNAAPTVGDTVVFTLTLSNAGPDAADAQVADGLPSGYAYVSDNGAGAYNAGAGIWTITGLAANGATTLDITATVNATGNYTNVAEVAVSNATDPNSTPGNNDPTEDDYAESTPVVNQIPVAVDDSGTTPVDTAISIPVLVNDSDPDADPLTVDSVTQPANGAVTSMPDGTVIYTPNTGFTGTDMFTYTISDGRGGFDTATVTIQVDEVSPTAVADSGVTSVNTPITLSILDNDTDPNGDPLTVVSVTQPPNGTVVINPDGTATYTPNAGFSGLDTFSYTIEDPNGNSDSALVSITVDDVRPRAVDDTGTTPFNTPVTVTVLANDTDPNGDPLTVIAISQPANGSAVLNADGTVTYTPNAGFTGVDTFTYTIDDGNGNTDNAAVTITVEAAAAVEGDVWLDADVDDVFGVGERPLTGWIVELTQGGSVLATTTVAADGSYSFGGLIAGSGYGLVLRNPTSNAFWNSLDSLTLPAGTTTLDQNLPVDPSGVLYDATARTAIAGVIVSITNSTGTALPAVCLQPNQQDQVTDVDGFYRFDVNLGADAACPSGETYLLTVVAPAGYANAPSILIPPAAGPLDPTGGPDPFQVSSQPTPPTGADPTVYYLDIALETGDPDVINNHIPLDSVSGLAVSKRALTNEVVIGGMASYQIVIDNPGPLDVVGLDVVDTPPATFVLVAESARLDGNPVTVSGVRPVVFGGIDIPAGGNATLTYVLRAGAGVVPGTYPNTAVAQLNGTPVSNVSTATINVVGDTDFSETTIIGKVFNDIDGDGWQDDGEAGIPGVRLATVTGLLIETDQYGRYHLAGVDGGFMERGRNFILKIDPATLPADTEFTTENPRVLRITQGMLNRIDFGVRLPGTTAGCCTTMEAKLSEFFFTKGSAELRPEFMPVIKQLADKLREHGGGTLTIKGSADASQESSELAGKRAEAVRRALQQYLGEEFMKQVEIKTQSAAAPSARNGDKASTVRSTLSGYASRGVLALLSLVAGPAYAQEMCDLETCRTEDGYLVEIIEHDSSTASASHTQYASRDKKHVDLSGRFGVTLPNQGKIWATEDPATAEPRLAVQGPSVVPASDGRLKDAVNFTVYTNYPAFIDTAELIIYDSNDDDMVSPLARLPLSLTGLNTISWDGVRADGRSYLPGDELMYIVRARDAEGRVDETGEKSMEIVDARGFEYSQAGAESSAAQAGKQMQPLAPAEQLPLAGNVLVMRPPTVESRQYTLTPRFGTRKINLSAGDRAQLDEIIASWSDAKNITITTVGHTDNIRIAPQNRKEFANNQVLSEARARSVADYIARGLGASSSQVRAIGRGPAQPVASNATAEGRAQNRRVELTVTGEQVLENVDMRLLNPDSGKEASVQGDLNSALASMGTGARKAMPNGQRSWRSGEGLVGIYSQNDLVQQNIPVYGSRVRLYGHGVQESLDLVINGQPLPVDREGRFAVEYLMPVGKHRYAVGFLDAQGNGQTRFLDVDVTGRHMFLVGLADMTISGSDLSGSMEPLSGDDRYQEDFLVEGRLAFYLKGKVKGKYLVTAQMDTQEEELGDLFSNIHRKDPRSVFRRLDPDRYYPVYGDDSTTYSDTDTQGRMYVRVDWDKSEALWGNYHTGVTGNEFGQYNRSLYGAKFHNRSLDTTELGEAKRDATVFVSEAQTSLGHSEFLGTGGSLYYLRHQDILPGSEKAHVEIRDRDSNRVVQNLTLVRGTDYEIDELQGRLILAKPLAQVTQQFAPSLIKDQPLDGNDVILLVDYEYVPDAFQSDQMTVGGRGKQWINDKVAVGVTAVDENRGGEDYQMLGADVTLQAGRGTYLKAEIARTEATQAPVFYSDNGGLTFATTNPINQADREGDALSLEGRINFREQGLTQTDWTAATWWRQSDAGFSAARRDTGTELTEYGAEVTGEVNNRLRLSARLTVVDRAGQSEDQRVAVQGDYRLTDKGTVSAEVRRNAIDDIIAGTSLDSTLAALRYTYRLGANLEVYGTGQFTLNDDIGVANNDLGTIGARWRVSDRTNVGGEFSSGHRGEGATMSLEHRLNANHRVYGSYTMSTDRTTGAESQVAIGHRSRISNQLSVFNERQFVRGDREAGVSHAFGLDFAPLPGFNLGLSLQHGELEALSGLVERDAATITGGYRSDGVTWQSKLEFRDDSGTEEREQRLTSNRLNFRLNEDLRMLMRLNYSDTDDLIDSNFDARFVEGGVGFAYRPVGNDRLNLLAKYTYLYDLPSLAQANAGTDQKSNVYSIEGIYRVSPRWELGAKLAQRSGELRANRDTGAWFESTTDFQAIRARYHLIRRWDGVLEYRRLDVKENGSTRDGLLAQLDRHFNDNFKIGVGYNFTDFSDDLTDLDYDHKGWFLNLVGKY